MPLFPFLRVFKKSRFLAGNKRVPRSVTGFLPCVPVVYDEVTQVTNGVHSIHV
ncbi:hypothetical protein [Klebsiella phage SAKp11]